MQCHITKQFVYSFRLSDSVHIIFLGLTNPDVNIKRMHQLYEVDITCCLLVNTILCVVIS